MGEDVKNLHIDKCSDIISILSYKGGIIMSKCIRCGKNEGIYPHYNGGKVCEQCLGFYFQCPDCTVVYDRDDPEHYDAGGFCPKHIADH